MPKTIQSLTGQNVLSTLISLFQDNGKNMTVTQIREAMPAYLNCKLSEDDLDQIITVLKSYSEGSAAADAAEEPSLLTMNIFSDLGDGTYQLNASDETCQQILSQIGFPAEPEAFASETADLKENEGNASSETFTGTPGTSFETFDSFTETTATPNQTGTKTVDLKSLEKNLSDASASVQEAADRAASLKTQGATVYEETTTISSDSAAEKTRQQMSEAYQKRMEAYQNRVNELQDALDAANREKELAQNQADSSDMDAYKLQQDMQSTIDSREETIRQYRLDAEGNQKHIDDLQKALAAAKESLENARARALASQQEIQSLRDDADAYYAYGAEMLNDYQEAADGYEDRIHALQGQLDDAEGTLADTRSQAEAAKQMSDDYAARLGSMQDELDQAKTNFADASDRLNAAGRENSQLKNDLNDYAKLNDQMVISYKQDIQDYQDKIDDLQKSLADFNAQAESLRGDIDTLNADKDDMYKAYEQNIDSYRDEIRSLEEDLRSAQEKLADADDRANANGQEADALREETASFKTRLGDLEDRLNAALQALESARAQADQSNAEAQSLKQDVNDFNTVKDQMISSYKQDSDAWKNRMYKLQNALKDASQELVDTKKRADASAKEAGDLKQNLGNLLNSREKMIAAHQKEIDTFKNQINVLKKALDDAEQTTAAANADAETSAQDAADLRNQIDGWQKRISELQAELDASKADLARARSQADDAGTQAQGLQSSIDDLNTERDQMIASWNKDAKDYDTEIALLKAEMANLGDKLADATARANQAEADNADLRKNAADFAALRDQMTNSYNQDMADYQNQIDGLRSQLDASEKNADGLRADVDVYNDFKDEMIRSYREDTDGYQNQIANLKNALRSSRADLADALDRADAADAEANGLRHDAADFEAFKKQMIASYTQDRDAYDSEIDSLQNQLNSLQAALDESDKAVRDARARAENAEGDNALLQDNIDTINSEKERIAVIYRDETGSLRDQIAQLQDELNAVRQAMQDAQVRASASEQALSNANARADSMENTAGLYSSSFTEIDNSYISTIGDYQNTLDGIQAELDRAYQALYNARNAAQTTEVHVTEIRQNPDGTFTESTSSSVYDDLDPIDVDIQLAEDKIARQQQKILDHQDSINETSSDFMKAVYQAEINHNKNVIDRQTQKLADLKNEKMWRNQ